MNARSTFVVVSLVLLSGCDESCVSGPISAAGATPLQIAVTKAESPWARNAKTCQLGGYEVIVPAEGAPAEIFVTRNGTTVWIDERGTIYVRSKDGSLVSLQDLNHAGRFDWISYSAIDAADGQKYDVIDADADGPLDTKFGEKGGFVNLEGEWARMEKRGDQLGAIVGGDWRPIESEKRMLYRLAKAAS